VKSRGFSLIELVFVLTLTGVIAAIAVPASGNLLATLRLSGDARTLFNTASVAKLRAASDFSQGRVYLDLTQGLYHIETWQKTTNTWVVESGDVGFSQGVSLGFQALAAPPPNTQAVIGQAPACLTAANAPIAGTACIIFNSRGIPVDATGTPTNSDAFYIGDGTTVYALTVSATGFVQLWRNVVNLNIWVKQ
jgi:prepilin-type N-terminal cleavage/methylation domain-containing protein